MDFLRESVEIQGPKNCPFCPGAESKTPPEILVYGRNGGGANTPGWNIRVVPNRFPALGIEGELDREGEGLFDKMNGVGAHEVIVETPEHAATLATLACHTSVRAGQSLTPIEQQALIDQLGGCEGPRTCPPGRTRS